MTKAAKLDRWTSLHRPHVGLPGRATRASALPQLTPTPTIPIAFATTSTVWGLLDPLPSPVSPPASPPCSFKGLPGPGDDSVSVHPATWGADAVILRGGVRQAVSHPVHDLRRGTEIKMEEIEWDE
eukprot:CAMPEP_0174312874 /NCGR_PEP_ID=MMETSP0810-20121108/4591_1 /TAXON_ID=73025 ORGANISM="Eutreptiella gymnastica-like, Strain CCMP1594" /NCGR_SAMPLE_ID=MMETSP0810 /ASSEMBLY_ACC=CAM_ASM_000659 /LENGTH=125 /DNA_ID=CAMNT_0015421433 /DNA_START=531 /DNA_END=912 /DNA_ORIENTATION=-